MAKPILVLGKSGTGKSTSLRNLPSDQTLIITPNAKELPWRGSASQYIEGKNVIRTADMNQVATYIEQAAQGSTFKFVVVEDTTHYQNKRMMQNDFIASKDYGKWNRFGADFYKMVAEKMETYRDDLWVIFIGHTDHKDDGTVGLRTSGKLLDNTIDIPSYFTTILHAVVLKSDGKLEYKFQTKNDGYLLAKSPLGMFDDMYVDNDMSQIINVIAQYNTAAPDNK